MSKDFKPAEKNVIGHLPTDYACSGIIMKRCLGLSFTGKTLRVTATLSNLCNLDEPLYYIKVNEGKNLFANI